MKKLKLVIGMRIKYRNFEIKISNLLNIYNAKEKKHERKRPAWRPDRNDWFRKET